MISAGIGQRLRSSLDRITAGAPSNDHDLMALRRRAYTEQGIAIIDLGKVRSRDFLFSKWLRQEVERQLGIAQTPKGNTP